MNNKGKRNCNLDIVKAICAFMVVTIHCPSVLLPPYIEASTRIAVPMFFCISGYFYNKPVFSITFRKISKMLLMLAVSELFYACMYIIGGQADKVKAAIDNGPVNILMGRFILWGPGWFLLVSSYTYVMAYILVRTGIQEKAMMVLTVLLLVIQWLNPLGINSVTLFLRGLPYFIMGMLIRRYEARLRKIPFKAYAVSAVVCEIMVLAEKYLCLHRDLPTGYPILAGTIPLVISIFCICLFHETFNAPFLIYTGRNLSMYIYCLHVAVMSVLSRFGIEYESLWLCVMCIPATFVVYHALNTAKNVLKHFAELPGQLESLYGLEAANPVPDAVLPVYREGGYNVRPAFNPVYSEAAYRDDAGVSEPLYDEREYKAS